MFLVDLYYIIFHVWNGIINLFTKSKTLFMFWTHTWWWFLILMSKTVCFSLKEGAISTTRPDDEPCTKNRRENPSARPKCYQTFAVTYKWMKCKIGGGSLYVVVLCVYVLFVKFISVDWYVNKSVLCNSPSIVHIYMHTKKLLTLYTFFHWIVTTFTV